MVPRVQQPACLGGTLRARQPLTYLHSIIIALLHLSSRDSFPLCRIDHLLHSRRRDANAFLCMNRREHQLQMDLKSRVPHQTFTVLCISARAVLFCFSGDQQEPL